MARRSKGEGSITQRADGSWQGALQVEGRRRFVTGKTEKEVKAKLAALQREAHQNGALSDPGTKTLNDLLDLWLNTAGPTLKPRRVHDYECHARRYVRHTIGHLRLTKVTPERLQALYSSLQGKGLARVPAHVHALRHRALGMAVMWQMLPSNPADRVLKPGYRAEREDCGTAEQFSAFLRGTSQDRHGPPMGVPRDDRRPDRGGSRPEVRLGGSGGMDRDHQGERAADRWPVGDQQAKDTGRRAHHHPAGNDRSCPTSPEGAAGTEAAEWSS
jgi:hypothetical protein